MLEFTYKNVPPPAARGKGKLNINRIRLWRDGDKLKYDRRYVSKDGTVSENPIEHTFTGTSVLHVAKNIHWGCCGWSAGGHQLTQLQDLIRSTVEPDDNGYGQLDQAVSQPQPQPQPTNRNPTL
jgi:hypothetical protein